MQESDHGVEGPEERVLIMRVKTGAQGKVWEHMQAFPTLHNLQCYIALQSQRGTPS